MTFIHWADPDELFDLLMDYVADERLAEVDDQERALFLDELASALTDLAADVEPLSTQETIGRLRELHDSQPPEFGRDPVLSHLDDCIQELERIMEQADARP